MSGPFDGLVPRCKAGSSSAGDHCRHCHSYSWNGQCCECRGSHKCNICPRLRPDLHTPGTSYHPGSYSTPGMTGVAGVGGFVPLAMTSSGRGPVLVGGYVGHGGRSWSPSRGRKHSGRTTGARASGSGSHPISSSSPLQELKNELARLVLSGSSDARVKARIQELKDTIKLLS